MTWRTERTEALLTPDDRVVQLHVAVCEQCGAIARTKQERRDHRCRDGA